MVFCKGLDPRSVRELFDRVSSRYDLVNTVLSLGLDRHWRKGLSAVLPEDGRVLDLCTGTGRLTAAALSKRPRLNITGVDMSAGMLERARKNNASFKIVRADCCALPFRGGVFSAAMAAFGLRNVADGEIFIDEAARVIEPGGKLLILEFLPPRNMFIRWYLNRIVPLLGGLLSASPGSYSYLSRSVSRFLTEEKVSELLECRGMKLLRTVKYFPGMVCLFIAQKCPQNG